MTWWQRPGRTFPVDTEPAWPAINVMSLDFREVVGDVVEKVDLAGADRFEECLPCSSCEYLAVRLCVIGRRRHGTQIRTTLGRLHRDTSELTIGHRDAVARHCRSHRFDVI